MPQICVTQSILPTGVRQTLEEKPCVTSQADELSSELTSGEFQAVADCDLSGVTRHLSEPRKRIDLNHYRLKPVGCIATPTRPIFAPLHILEAR